MLGKKKCRGFFRGQIGLRLVWNDRGKFLASTWREVELMEFGFVEGRRRSRCKGGRKMFSGMVGGGRFRLRQGAAKFRISTGEETE